MAKGCDSSWDFDYKSRVDALVDEGYTFIGRYLNHSAGVRNGLTVSEANRLSNAGVFICALYESDSGTSISHFTRSNGIADSTSCMFSSVLSQDSLFRDKILWAEDVFSAHNIFR